MPPRRTFHERAIVHRVAATPVRHAAWWRSSAAHRARSRLARIVLLVVGAAGIAAGVSGLLWTRLGPGPLDVFITAVVHRSGVPITFVVWSVSATMMTVATLLGRRPGVGTFVLPLVSGSLLPVFIGILDRWAPPNGITPLGVAVHVVATMLVGMGAGAVVTAGLGAGTGELVSGATSARLGRPEPLVRTGVELSWLALGVALGGRAGVGTVLVAGLIGPAVRGGRGTVVAAIESEPGRRARARVIHLGRPAHAPA